MCFDTQEPPELWRGGQGGLNALEIYGTHRITSKLSGIVGMGCSGNIGGMGVRL